MVYFFDEKAVLISAIIYILILGLLKYFSQKNFVFYIFFTLMYLYINLLLKYTQFPIYNDEFQRSIWGPFSLEKNFNLIPFKNIVNSSSLYNIILTVPFGFLLPFICRMNLLKLLLAGIGFSGILELLQALAGILAGYSTRVIDINDLICNTAGAAAGYGLFLSLYMAVRKISEKKASVNFLFTYIIERK